MLAAPIINAPGKRCLKAAPRLSRTVCICDGVRSSDMNRLLGSICRNEPHPLQQSRSVRMRSHPRPSETKTTTLKALMVLFVLPISKTHRGTSSGTCCCDCSQDESSLGKPRRFSQHLVGASQRATAFACFRSGSWLQLNHSLQIRHFLALIQTRALLPRRWRFQPSVPCTSGLLSRQSCLYPPCRNIRLSRTHCDYRNPTNKTPVRWEHRRQTKRLCISCDNPCCVDLSR